MNTKQIIKLVKRYNKKVWHCNISKEEIRNIKQLLDNHFCLQTLCNDLYLAGKSERLDK